MWKQLLRDDATLTKRQLGLLLTVAGAVVLIVTLVADQVRDVTGTFGTTQQLLTLAGCLGILIGLTLIPLGDRPA